MQAIAKAWERELDALHERLGSLFRRPEPRRRSLAYLKALLGAVERKNVYLQDEADNIFSIAVQLRMFRLAPPRQ
jgi:hypothetical protein